MLPAWQIWAVLGVLAVLGLRDKVIFLAARGEVYASFTVAFLFAGYGVDMILGAKLVCLVIWLGAATSKLNKHFPFVISTMMSNNPVFRPRFIKRMFFEHFPDDLRPGRLSRWLAHFSTAIEGLVPLVLFFSHGGWPTAIAAFVMLCFHFGILSSIPMGVPLEWNVFMMFSVLALFVGHASIGLGDLTTPRPILLFAVVAGTVVLGKPVSAQGFLPARHALLRGQLGHHAVVHQAVGRGRRSPTASSRSPACPPPNWRSSTAARRPRRSRCTWDTRSAPSTLTAARCSPWRTARWPATTRTTTS